tara:strand:+ start:6198 stop:7121 length:924 start_codon:yes stop_codon:yes gene_type:complete
VTTETKSGGQLERTLLDGQFAVTAEITPPLSADPTSMLDRAAPLKGLVDAVNVTEGASARAHLSSLAAAGQLVGAGLEPLLQINGRDRNKLLLERDILGAAALGVPNLLALRGDPISKGDEPEATEVPDLGAADIVQVATHMRDTGTLPSGRKIEAAPRFLVGATDMPIEPTSGWKPESLQRKLDAGADFIQTQFCFDADLLKRYMSALADAGIARTTGYLVGLGPLTSERQARWLVDNLWGTVIPEPVIDLLGKATDAREEGRRIVADIARAYVEIPGVTGVHMMGHRAEAESAEIIAASGLIELR